MIAFGEQSEEEKGNEKKWIGAIGDVVYGFRVVLSNAASLPEVCGDAAYYVDPYNVESIAQGMYRVLTDEDLRQSLIQKGLERVRLFSWEKSAREHLRVFEEVLNSSEK